MGLLSNPAELPFVAAGLLTAVVLHELAHGMVAYRLGDPTPKLTGRLTLNPLAHIDPVGLIMLIFFRFGWAKPVQVNPGNFANPRSGMMLVAVAGPLANVLVAFVAMSLIKVAGLGAGPAGKALTWIILYNVWLGVFNLLPFPPLDGSRVLAWFLPPRQAYALQRYEGVGWILLILLLTSGYLGRIINPVVEFLLYFLDVVTSFLQGAPSGI